MSLTPRLGCRAEHFLNWIDLPVKTFTNTVLGQRTLYSMTPRMFVTALVQYSSGTTSLSANMRFRWEYMPGSELFVVYTEGRDTAPPVADASRKPRLRRQNQQAAQILGAREATTYTSVWLDTRSSTASGSSLKAR